MKIEKSSVLWPICQKSTIIVTVKPRLMTSKRLIHLNITFGVDITKVVHTNNTGHLMNSLSRKHQGIFAYQPKQTTCSFNGRRCAQRTISFLFPIFHICEILLLNTCTMMIKENNKRNICVLMPDVIDIR